MYAERHIPEVAVESGLPVLKIFKAIGLKQVAAGNVALFGKRIVLFHNVHPMRAHINLIGNLVVTNISFIDSQIDKLGSRVELQACTLSHQACQGIAQQRLVAMIGHNGPFLRLGVTLAQELHLFIELQLIGFFLQACR